MNSETAGFRANFLWPNESGSIEQAGFEFANALTEAYREKWWDELKRRIASSARALEESEKGVGDE